MTKKEQWKSTADDNIYLHKHLSLTFVLLVSCKFSLNELLDLSPIHILNPILSIILSTEIEFGLLRCWEVLKVPKSTQRFISNEINEMVT